MMLPKLIAAHHIELSEACRRSGVERLELFGSAASGKFDEQRSDLDFLVSFKPDARLKAFDNFFDLRDRLEELFGRRIDLVTEKSLKNPYLARAIERQRQLVYAA